MTMTSKERAALRAECNQLKPLVHVGQEGISWDLIASLDDALRVKELVKVQLNRSVEDSAKSAAKQMAERTNAEVIQVIGKTVTLYRHNPKLTRKDGAPPPWK